VKQIRLREKVVKEILETEREYVKRLTAINRVCFLTIDAYVLVYLTSFYFLKGYVEPFSHNKTLKSFMDDEKTFSCIEEILLFNKLLLEDLTERIGAPPTEDNPMAGSKIIGDIFCRMVKLLDVFDFIFVILITRFYVLLGAFLESLRQLL